MKTRHIQGAFAGTYSDKFLADNKNKNINGEKVSKWTLIDGQPDAALALPFWNGSIWVENADLTTINTEKYVASLNTVVFNSRLWAKAIVMGKTTDEDLDYFEDVYTEKYNQCKDPNNSFDYFLELERVAEGYTDLVSYKQVVISKFETGQNFFKQAKAMLEVFRKIVLQHIENAEFDKAELKITELDNLDESLSPTLFANEFQRILNL